MASKEQLRQQQLIMNTRLRQMQLMATRQQQAAARMDQQNAPIGQQMRPLSMAMGSPYDDVPIVEPRDFDFVGQNALRGSHQSTSSSIVQPTVDSETSHTPAVLHHRLLLALGAGDVEDARALLASGAPIARQTPDQVLSAPPSQQIPLFELLYQYGWTPNTPSYYGAVLLPRAVNDLSLLRWLLTHGANPNLGPQCDYRDRAGGSDTNSCHTLQFAAAHGNVEAVKLLLDAGAQISNGSPLHYAAGACPPGANPHSGRVVPSKEFDVDRIPVMELLVRSGANVNQKVESRHMEPQYAIVHAVMVGAVERVRWLLEQGADPFAKGAFGSAVEYGSRFGCEEMKKVIADGIETRKRKENS